jgi:hypothetical protein
MPKRKKSALTESRESTAERISKAAMAQVESDTEHMRSKTERLRALRLAKEVGEATKRRSKGE